MDTKAVFNMTDSTAAGNTEAAGTSGASFSVQKKKGFVCSICGYIYEGETLPSDFICPWCKHPASDFRPL